MNHTKYCETLQTYIRQSQRTLRSEQKFVNDKKRCPMWDSNPKQSGLGAVKNTEMTA